MSVLKKYVVILFFFFFAGSSLTAQIRLPQPSPTVRIVQNFGVSEVTLDYSRPSLRGRTFGEGALNYYGNFWRTGANSATTITFGMDVTINGQALKAGKWGLYSIPDQNEWTIIFSKNTNVTDASAYKPEEDVLRLKIKPEAHTSTETFTIDFTDFTINSMKMSLKWDKFKITMSIQTQVKEQVIENTDREVSNLANALTQAANYAFENNETAKGKAWLDESISLEENYLNLHLKAKVLAKEGNFSEAVNLAERSLDLAKEIKNDAYVSENEKLINEWRPKMATQKGRR